METFSSQPDLVTKDSRDSQDSEPQKPRVSRGTSKKDSSKDNSFSGANNLLSMFSGTSPEQIQQQIDAFRKQIPEALVQKYKAAMEEITQTKDESDPKTKDVSEAKAKAETKAKIEPEPEPEPEAKVDPKAESEVEEQSKDDESKPEEQSKSDESKDEEPVTEEKSSTEDSLPNDIQARFQKLVSLFQGTNSQNETTNTSSSSDVIIPLLFKLFESKFSNSSSSSQPQSMNRSMNQSMKDQSTTSQERAGLEVIHRGMDIFDQWLNKPKSSGAHLVVEHRIRFVQE